MYEALRRIQIAEFIESINDFQDYIQQLMNEIFNYCEIVKILKSLVMAELETFFFPNHTNCIRKVTLYLQNMMKPLLEVVDDIKRGMLSANEQNVKTEYL